MKVYFELELKIDAFKAIDVCVCNVQGMSNVKVF